MKQTDVKQRSPAGSSPLMLLCAGLLAGCGASEAPPALDAGRPPDGGGLDAPPLLDTSPLRDTSPPLDASSDTTTSPDAPVTLDAGLIADGSPSDAPPSPPDAPLPPLDAGPSCPTFGAPVELGHVVDVGLAELSGLVESRVTPGILFAHGDNNTDLFAVRASDGEVRGHWTLRSGATALGSGDVEDIAMGPMPGGGIGLYVGDIGGGRSTLRIARLPEPTVPLTGAAASGPLAVEVMTVGNLFGFPIPDAETLLVDPLSGDIVIVQKDGAAHPCAIGPFVPGAIATADCSAPAIAGLTNPSGGDVSADGRFVILRNEGTAYLWVRPPGATLVAAFGGLRCRFETLEHADECNGEAIAFASDGLGIFTGSERGSSGGASCPLTHLHGYSLSP